MTPNGWILSDDTGISSKAIWSVMMGCSEESEDRDTPSDPSDFGRCYRLLKLFPEWENRLNEVALAFPKWAPMVREWVKMTSLYELDMNKESSPDLYEYMHGLYYECMVADGWVKTGPGSWKKDNSFCGVVGLN